MSKTFLESIVAYVATNIDDIFVLIFLYASAVKRSDFRKIMLGKYIGIYTILGISFLASWGLGFIPEDSETAEREIKTALIASSAIITIANSADNIGVYIPLFTEYTLPQMLVTVIVFAVMTFLWCILGEKIATLAPVQNMIRKYKRIAIPLVYILLGIYILIF